MECRPSTVLYSCAIFTIKDTASYDCWYDPSVIATTGGTFTCDLNLGGDHTRLATIWRICEITRIFSKQYPIFAEGSHVHQTFSMFAERSPETSKCSRDYLGNLTFDPKYPNGCSLPQIFAGFAICSPNSSQTVSTLAKCLPYDLKTIMRQCRLFHVTKFVTNCSLIDRNGVTVRCEQLTTNYINDNLVSRICDHLSMKRRLFWGVV